VALLSPAPALEGARARDVGECAAGRTPRAPRPPRAVAAPQLRLEQLEPGTQARIARENAACSPPCPRTSAPRRRCADGSRVDAAKLTSARCSAAAVELHRLGPSPCRGRQPLRLPVAATQQVGPGRLDPRRLHLRDHARIQALGLDEARATIQRGLRLASGVPARSRSARRAREVGASLSSTPMPPRKPLRIA